MCQWCRERIYISVRAVEYCHKLFHRSCFNKLQAAARATGGVL